ncbi:MAG: phosphodiester glycosidase family protein [Planctomycetota bacterium]
MSPTRRQVGGVRRAGAVALLAAACLGSGPSLSAEPIVLTPIERATEHGPIRGWAATVDLSAPGIEVVVSDADGDDDLDDADTHLAEGAEVVLTPMDSFVARTGVALAFNANFFAWKQDAYGNKTQADIIGLSVSDGEVISTRRRFDDHSPDPVLLFHAGGRGAVTRGPGEPGPPMGDSWDGVAGIGPSGTSDVPGTLLVKDGENLGHSARVQPLNRHPRTAAGVSEDGMTLYVVVIDGRQLGHSVGATLPEVAGLLIELGADDAVALDGGGSSSLIGRAGHVVEAFRHRADPDGDGWVTNRPSDGRYRPVANQVGLRLAGARYGAPPPFVPGAEDVFSGGKPLGGGEPGGPGSAEFSRDLEGKERAEAPLQESP